MNKKQTGLEEVLKIATSKGNYDYCEYHFGLANGLILAQAIVTNTEPKFLEKPKEWLEDKYTSSNTAYEKSMNIIGDLS